MLTSQFRNTQHPASKIRTTDHELTAKTGSTDTHPLGLPPISLLRPSTSRSSAALQTTGSTNVVTKDVIRILCLVPFLPISPPAGPRALHGRTLYNPNLMALHSLAHAGSSVLAKAQTQKLAMQKY